MSRCSVLTSQTKSYYKMYHIHIYMYTCICTSSGGGATNVLLYIVCNASLYNTYKVNNVYNALLYITYIKYIYNVYNMFRWRCYPCPVAVCNVYNVLLCNVYNVNITYSKYTIFLQVEVLPLPCRLKSLLSSLFTQSIKVLTMYFSTLFLQYFSRIFMDLIFRSFA